MDLARARGILGLDESSTPAHAERAYRLLRTHVEQRPRAVGDEQKRAAELRELDVALARVRAVPPPASAPHPKSTRAGRHWLEEQWFGVPRWVLLWAATALALAVAVGLALWLASARQGREVVVGSAAFGAAGTAADGDAPEPVVAVEVPDQAEGAQGADGAVPRSELLAEANLPSAVLEIRDAATGELAAEGPADSRSYWLAAGEYQLQVSHPDCPDRWDQGLRITSQDQVELSPEVCRETGWLEVQSNVEGGKVSIDGKRVGSNHSDKLSLASGEHKVEVAKQGYRTWKGLVEIRPAELFELSAELESLSAAEADAAPEPPALPAAVVRPPADPTPFERSGWHDEVTQWLLARYDSDRSGLLDTASEIKSIPCEEWLGLEAAFNRNGLGLPLTRFYGIDGAGSDWKENALGISHSMRNVAYVRMQGCGLR